MNALVDHGPGKRSGDLHILKGDVPEVKPGTILGHEAVGTMIEKGAGVTTLEVGDRVLVSCLAEPAGREPATNQSKALVGIV